MNKKEIISAKKIATLGMILALNVVLNRFSIHTDFFKLGFAFITLAMAGYLYGPVEAALIGVLGDVIGYFLNPVGAFFPGFTITAAISGIVFGLAFWNYKINWTRNIIAALMVQVVIGLGANTYCLSLLYGKGYFALLPGRLLQTAIMLVIQIALTRVFEKKWAPLITKNISNDSVAKDIA